MTVSSPVLQIEKRDTSKKVRDLRKFGRIPAISYGRGKETAHFSLDYKAFRKVFEKAGESTIIELAEGGKKTPVLVYDVDYDPVTDEFLHVDFYLVDMAKEVTAKIPLKLIGEAPAVKNLGGILTLHKKEITIKCLPKDLIHGIEVDVSGLDNFHQSIHVSDLKVPASVKVQDKLGDAVANVKAPKIEEEEKPAEAAVEGEAEAAEGTEAAQGAAKEEAVPEAGGKEGKE